MDNKAFATEFYEFLKTNDRHGDYDKISEEKIIAEINGYLSDFQWVKRIIKDFDEIINTFIVYKYNIADIQQIVDGLREIAAKLETEQNSCMVGEPD